VAALALAFTFVVRTYFLHKKRSEKMRVEEEKELRVWNGEDVVKECQNNVIQTLQTVSRLFTAVLQAYIFEDRKKVKKTAKQVQELSLLTKRLKRDVLLTLKRLEDDSVDAGHYYVQTLDYLREISHCLTFITDPVLEHLENNHPTISREQEQDMLQLNQDISSLFKGILLMLKARRFDSLDEIIKKQTAILTELERIKKQQVKLIKAEKAGTRNSLLMFNLLAETKNLLLNTINMLKSQRDFLKRT
jgi:hypothetical protein